MDLSFSVEQKQITSQKLIHMVTLLQMNRQELLAYLEEQSMENPLLEIEDTVYHYLPCEKEEDWMEQLEDQKKETLADSLCQQLLFENFQKPQQQVLTDIIFSLDENGFFYEELEAVAKRNHVSKKIVEECLKMIQSLEPVGVGAVNLQNCLLLQLERKEEQDDLTKIIIEDYMESLGKNHLNKIAKETGYSIQQVRSACEKIRKLNPKPLNGLYERENIKYILPDFIVTVENGTLNLEVADHCADYIRIQPLYMEMEPITADDQAYIHKKTQEATELIELVQKREKTLQRIIKAIIIHQKDFFQHGQINMRPLTMLDIAEQLDIDESTVSRAVKGKYFQCEWGVFPCKYLFAKIIQGNTWTTEVLKRKIQELVNQEDQEKPFSDQKLQMLLSEEGHKISRRTVAKYRMQMGIPDASGRKVKYKSNKKVK